MALGAGIGYDGSVSETLWKTYESSHGPVYSFGKSPDSMRPSLGGTGDRAVTIASGEAWAKGVRVPNDADVVMNHVTLATGERWDLVVLRRNWETNANTFVIIQGGTTRALPARTTTTTIDDQPVYLAHVQAVGGVGVVTEVVDLRVHQFNSGAIAYDTLVLTYLDEIGSQVRIGDTEWHCVVIAGSAAWVPSRPSTSPLTLIGAGTALSGTAPAPSAVNYSVHSDSVVVHTDGAGYAGITFPTPFPTGLLNLIVTNGDVSACTRVGVAGAPWGLGTRISFYVRADVANRNIRVNYLAIGW